IVSKDRPFEGRDVPLYPSVELRQRDGDGGVGRSSLEHGGSPYTHNEHYESLEKPGKTCPASKYASYENKRRKSTVKILSHDVRHAAENPVPDVRAAPRAGSAPAAPADRRSPRSSHRSPRPDPAARHGA